MEKKIGNLVLAYLLIQCSAIFAVHRTFNTDSETFVSFLIHVTLWHTLLLLFLVLHKSEFATIHEGAFEEKNAEPKTAPAKINNPDASVGAQSSMFRTVCSHKEVAVGFNTLCYDAERQGIKPSARINTANKITLCRISSVPLVAFLLKNHHLNGIKFVLTAVLIFVFLTDLLDGFIARKYRQETGVGRMLDSMSDYALLTLVSVVYFQLGILPGWFFFLILSRLLFQAIGMLCFMLLKFPLAIQSTKGGKITIAATMILYTAELLRFFLPCLNDFKHIFMLLEYGCAVIVFVFLFEKIYIFYCHYKKYREHSIP